MKRTMLRLAASLALAAAPAAAHAQSAQACPGELAKLTKCYTGADPNGATYWIAIPLAWNKTLVMHVHGGPCLSPITPDSSVEDLERFAVTVRQGFAWAGSSYRRPGYGVRMAAEDTDNLRKIFIKAFGQPARTLLHGQSWGGNVAAKAIELYAVAPNGSRQYDGAVLTNGMLLALAAGIGGAWLFVAVNFVLKAAPLAAFGAIAYTVGRYGLVSVAPLLELLGAIYLTTIVFVAVFLGTVARCCGFSLWRLIVYIRKELVLVVATSSSVAAMPRLIDKLERAGCPDALARVLVPTGYSFNLNGSSIYLTLALVFLAQASDVKLAAADYAAILAIAMITSKGSSGIAGSAFVALGATLALVPAIPAGTLLFILSIERLLKCRSLANVIGNGVACLAVAAWMGKLDRSELRTRLARRAA